MDNDVFFITFKTNMQVLSRRKLTGGCLGTRLIWMGRQMQSAYSKFEPTLEFWRRPGRLHNTWLKNITDDLTFDTGLREARDAA